MHRDGVGRRPNTSRAARAGADCSAGGTGDCKTNCRSRGLQGDKEMSIASGTHLGPYEIVGPLGSGGMGEVYKANDKRLNRIVAIKVLPEHISSQPEAKQRLEREAQTLASLSHPH